MRRIQPGILALLLLVSVGTASAAASAPALPPAVEAVRSALRGGDLDAAIEAAESAVESLAQDSRAWMWLGRAYGRQAQESSIFTMASWAGKTREAMEKAVALDADNVDARFDLTMYYLQAPGIVGGGRDKAEAQIAELAKRDVAYAKVAEATAARMDDDDDKVEPLLKEALALNPDHEQALMSYSGYLLTAKRFDDAAALWKDVLQRTPDRPIALYQRGRVAALSGSELEAGLAAMDRFIEIGEVPDSMSMGGAHWRRGQLLEKTGQRDSAIAAFQLAVKLEPTLDEAKQDLKRMQRS